MVGTVRRSHCRELLVIGSFSLSGGFKYNIIFPSQAYAGQKLVMLLGQRIDCTELFGSPDPLRMSDLLTLDVHQTVMMHFRPKYIWDRNTYV